MVEKFQRPGPYVALAVRYWEDDRILRASLGAEVLFTRAVAFCGASKSDGFIGDRQISLMSVKLRSSAGLVQELCNLGLWQKTEDASGNPGYRIVNWLKWNRSEEYIAAARATDAARQRKRRHGVRHAGVTADVQRESRDASDVSLLKEVENEVLRTPSGSVRRTSTGGAPLGDPGQAPVAPPVDSSKSTASMVEDVPPPTDWREERKAATPPDLTALRALLARTAKETKARTNYRPQAMAELTQHIAVNGSEIHAEGRE